VYYFNKMTLVNNFGKEATKILTFLLKLKERNIISLKETIISLKEKKTISLKEMKMNIYMTLKAKLVSE